MKKFKLIDFWMSILLIIVFLVLTIINKDYTFITGYAVTGSWQVISMLVHAHNHWFTYKGGVRRSYHWITVVSLLSIPVGSFLVLFFLAPVMAIYYTYLCYDEVYVKMQQRPLSLLK
ncbi:hypothetical protein BH11BAC4_BH11BAC4_25590 [soil metagenome]